MKSPEDSRRSAAPLAAVKHAARPVAAKNRDRLAHAAPAMGAGIKAGGAAIVHGITAAEGRRIAAAIERLGSCAEASTGYLNFTDTHESWDFLLIDIEAQTYGGNLKRQDGRISLSWEYWCRCARGPPSSVR